MFIAIDFDGTCVKHEFPKVGEEIGAVAVLKKLVAAGHKLILFTMRSDDPKKGRWVLTDAIEWFNHHQIPLFSINGNPTQHTWTSSPKVYAHLYIDDAALGTPLVFPKTSGHDERPWVDWKKVQKLLIKQGVIPKP